ncbi:DUF2927 domain-containing protein [Frigidibacter sp. ROC022]|uniref:DUF2927 domain-containing protein n=1 Tax=Frigidibacter sp. ROC022 TaxID=2971796 RepID=UPI00215ACC0F|nr:DUF2927 domain-containing protein [Frigidibacter sp. ROC022]MCR8726410.1 DUF2927 domain-containing protein [Frigidibacter sp. ROC022]
MSLSIPTPFRRLAPRLALLAGLALTACSPVTPDAAVTSRAAGPLRDTLPPMKRFAAGHDRRPTRPNSELARDFLDLTFQLESGRALPVLTRFEGPITVRVEGKAPPTLVPDLERLLARLRNEAGLNIHRIKSGQASVTIATVSRGELQRLVPQAACFVSPRISSWSEYKASRRSPVSDWTTLRERTRMAVFIPSDVAPQEIRDCLHEELAQALGPVNDLYRLPDSVFNDDNFHTVLTGFDMLMLRVTYAPELHSGMSKPEVAARLPALLARLNPRGGQGGIGVASETPRLWVTSIETALGARTPASRRRAAAKQAVSLANAQGWNDCRLAFSLYVLGRLSIAAEPEQALASFLQAEAIYRARPQTRLQAAHVAMQLAAYALSSGNTDAVLHLADANIPAAARAENAALLAQLMLMKSEALKLSGRRDEARVVRQDALGWARYGFGSDGEVRARAGEIAGLVPGLRVAAK